MSVSLTTIIDGNPVVDALANSQTVACPRCSQTYRLAYSDSESNKVKDWLRLAEIALRKDDAARHDATAIPPSPHTFFQIFEFVPRPEKGDFISI